MIHWGWMLFGLFGVCFRDSIIWLPSWFKIIVFGLYMIVFWETYESIPHIDYLSYVTCPKTALTAAIVGALYYLRIWRENRTAARENVEKEKKESGEKPRILKVKLSSGETIERPYTFEDHVGEFKIALYKDSRGRGRIIAGSKRPVPPIPPLDLCHLIYKGEELDDTSMFSDSNVLDQVEFTWTGEGRKAPCKDLGFSLMVWDEETVSDMIARHMEESGFRVSGILAPGTGSTKTYTSMEMCKVLPLDDKSFFSVRQPGFIPCKQYEGKRPNMVYKLDKHGPGYYRDATCDLAEDHDFSQGADDGFFIKAKLHQDGPKDY